MGGKALPNVSEISADIVVDVYDQFVEHVVYDLLGIGSGDFEVVGSSLKKSKGETAGDIDFVLSDQYDLETIDKVISKKYSTRHMKGLGILSIAYPAPDNKFVQIDLISVPNIEVAEYTFFSPNIVKDDNILSPFESKYKGVYRNELIAAICKGAGREYLTPEQRKDVNGNPLLPIKRYYRYQWNLRRGVQIITKEQTPRKDNSGYLKKEEIVYKKDICRSLEEMIEFIFGNKVSPHQVMTVEGCINMMKLDSFPFKDFLPEILETAIEFYKNRKLNVPIEVTELYADVKPTQRNQNSVAAGSG